MQERPGSGRRGLARGRWTCASPGRPGLQPLSPSPQAEEEQACPGPQEEEEEVRVLTLPLQAHHAMEKMEEFVYKVLSWWGGSRLTRPGLSREHRTFINTLNTHS